MDRSDNRDKGALERMGEQIGAATGRTFGRVSQNAVDVVGSVVGGGIDSLGEWWSSPEADRAAGTFDQSRDQSCRSDFESRGATERSYDDVRPLYQFGHMASQNPEFRGRAFSEVEPDLQRSWGDESRKTHGDWNAVRGYVGFGYAEDDQTPGAGR